MAARNLFDLRSSVFRLSVSPVNRSLFLAQLHPEASGPKQASQPTSALPADPSGAVIYVVAVVSFWSFSIFLLIISYVRKNRVDRNVSLYLKQIQMVRSRSDREKVINYVNSLWKEEKPPSKMRLGSPFLSPRLPRRKTFRKSYPQPNRPRRLQRINIPTIFVEESGPDTATSDNISTASDLSVKDDATLC